MQDRPRASRPSSAQGAARRPSNAQTPARRPSNAQAAARRPSQPQRTGRRQQQARQRNNRLAIVAIAAILVVIVVAMVLILSPKGAPTEPVAVQPTQAAGATVEAIPMPDPVEEGAEEDDGVPPGSSPSDTDSDQIP